MARVETRDSASTDRTLAELHSSAKTGDLPRFEDALAKWDNDGALALRNVLSTASKAGHAGIVTYLLENTNGVCKITAPAVRWASSRKHWTVIQAFVDSGWDINSPSEGGNTCPILKEVLPSEEHVHWYLDHGANPSFRSAGGDNHIPSFAGKFGTVGTIRILHSAGVDFAKSNALHMAAASASKGRLEVMSYLLDELHVPINQREYGFDQILYNEWKDSSLHGGTALHAAVREKKFENVNFLLNRGIDQESKDGRGCRAVDIAKELGLDAILQLLGTPVQEPLP